MLTQYPSHLLLNLKEFGFSKSSGLSLSALMAYVRPQLEASDEKVRMSAVEVTVSCYFHKGERTQQYVANLKPALLKLLEARFSEVLTLTLTLTLTLMGGSFQRGRDQEE